MAVGLELEVVLPSLPVSHLGQEGNGQITAPGQNVSLQIPPLSCCNFTSLHSPHC